MGNCNCKKDDSKVIFENKLEGSSEKKPLIIRGVVMITKIILFVIASAIAAIIVIPFSTYMLFKIMFLNEGIDVSDALLSIGKTLKKTEKEEDDEDDEDYDEDEEFEFKNEDEISVLESK